MEGSYWRVRERARRRERGKEGMIWWAAVFFSPIL